MAFVLNVSTGLEEEAEIVSPMTAEDTQCFVDHWKPVIDAKRDELKANNNLTRDSVIEFSVQDGHWKWEQKRVERTPLLAWSSFALRCGGRTQGLLFLNSLQTCRHTLHAGKPMIYVDLVASAPWNRPKLAKQRQYKYVGHALIVEAILQSEQEGFDGRIGLHSLPGAESFYRDEFGMTLIGPDAKYENMNYFEMTAELAAPFLNEA